MMIQIDKTLDFLNAIKDVDYSDISETYFLIPLCLE